MRNNWSGIAQLQNGKKPLGKKLGGAEHTARNQVLSWRLLRKRSAQFASTETETATANKTTSSKADTVFTESKAT